MLARFRLCLFCCTVVAGPTVTAQSLPPGVRWKAGQAGRVLGGGSVNGQHPERKHWIVQFAANPTADQLTALSGHRARIVSYVAESAYIVSAPSEFELDGLGL